ncbi:surface protein [Caballeronia glathei]|nr:YadA-like family protein [Caballeronia glathei]CDY74556.1 surface protein [Caballeronia glathei]
MNKTYKSVWNETTGTWVAVSELENGRSKSKRARTAISKAILAQVAAGGLSLAGASAAMAGPIVEGTATGTNATAIGSESLADVADGVAIGTGASANADTGANASKTGAVAIGNAAEAYGSGTAVGTGASAGSDSLAIGSGSSASLKSIAIGANARSFNTSAVALGESASAGAAKSLALGANSNAMAAGAVALGSESVANRANTISVGSAAIKRQIANVADATQDNDAVNLSQLKKVGLTTDSSGNATNAFVAYDAGSSNATVTLAGASGTKITKLKAGDVAASSTDAINGSQLYNVASSAADAIGGGAAVGADGKISKPTYTIGGEQVTGIEAALNKAASGGTESVQYDSTAHDKVTLGGAGKPAVKLTNVADGTADSDAVNVKQMNSQITKITETVTPAVDTLKYMSFSQQTGENALARGVNSVAVGGNSYATGDQALAFGASARSTSDNSVAVGYGAQASRNNSVALGANSVASGENLVSVGSTTLKRRIVNVADATSDNDAVNLGQVKTLLAQPQQAPVSRAAVMRAASSLTPDKLIASGPTVNTTNSIEALGTDAIAVGLTVTANGKRSVAVGSNSAATAEGAVSVGYGTIAGSVRSAAFGHQANVVADRGLALGYLATVNTSGVDAIAIGSESQANSDSSIAIGRQSIADGKLSAALGNETTVSGDGSFSLGNRNSVTAANTFVLGNNVTKTTGTNTVVLGSGSDGSLSNVISVGAKGSERKIVNVASGAVNATSTDAINGSQLYNTASTTAAALGGGAAVGADGKISAPTYNVGGKDYADVGKALDAVAASSGGSAADAVKYDTSAHDKVTLGGTATAAPVVLANVAAGKAETDAVNVKQLTALGGKVDSLGNITNAFVAYDDATKAAVTLGGSNGTQIHNVAAGVAGKDAVNLDQLTAAGLKVGTSGEVTNAFVAYDDATKSKVTLGGTATAAPVVLANVAAGKAETDAVNVKQLTALGGKVDSLGNITNAFVAYDDATKAAVTLGGSNGTQVHNVAAGVAGKDAVNLDQLTAAGLKVGTSGEVTNAFVAYDDATKSKVTLGGTATAAPVVLANVAAGKAETDAVNVKQLTAFGGKVDSSGNVTNAFVAYDSTAKDLVTLQGGASGTKITNLKAGALTSTSTDAINGSQLYNTASSTAAALGGGATVGADGKISAPTYKVGGNDYKDVGTALDAVVASSGGSAADAVKYDTSAHDKVTLGGTAAAAPVVLANVAAGKAETDAVNVKQLTALGGKVDSLGNITNAFVAYDNATKAAVTLGGSNGTQIHNVAAGTAGKDAVNLDQLTAAGLKVGTSGEVTNAFVAYDDATKSKVTLGGSNGTQIHNVAAGTVGKDAVNLDQLTAAGLKVGTSGEVTNAFVAYDSAAKDLVTLAGASGTKITNLTAGAVTSTSKDAINGSQLYNTASSTAAALGGGATVGADGKISQPSYQIGDKTYGDVGSALNGISGAAASLKYVSFGTSIDETGNPHPAAVARGVNAVAIGGNAAASEENSFALGTKSRAFGVGSVVIGYGSQANGANSVAIGANSVASGDNLVSVGNSSLKRRIVNVADATNKNDAVNLGQVETLLSQARTTSQQAPMSRAAVMRAASSLTPDKLIASGPTVNTANSIEALGTDAIAVGLTVTANGKRSVAMGSNSAATAEGAVSVGYGTIAGSVRSAAFGHQANVVADRGLALGYLATVNTSGVDAIAIGSESQANSDSSIAIGRQSIADGKLSAALGNETTVSGDGSFSLGNKNSVTAANTFVLGNNVTKTTGTNTVVLGSGSDGSQSNVISVGAKGSERKIVNVASGTDDTDAVNVKQLNDKVASIGGGGSGLVTQDAGSKNILVASALDGAKVDFKGTAGERELINVAKGTGTNSAATVGQLQPVVAALGGGASVNPDGSITGPSYTVQGQTKGDVGSAITSLDTGLTDVKNQINGAGLGLVSQDATSREITIGAKTDGTVINAANQDGVARTIKGVAAGELSASSFDAVNGSQLHSVGSGLATAIGGGAALNPDGSITQPTFVVGGTSVHNVGDAVSNIDGRVTSNTNEIAKINQTIINGGAGGGGAAVANAVKYDSDAHDKVTFGKEGTTASLTNLTDAKLASDSTDAVTGKQLFATNAKIDDLGTAIKNVSTTGSSVISVGPVDGGGVGPAASATGSGSLALGGGSSAGGTGSIAIGNGSNAGGNGAVAVGKDSGAGGTDSLALGNGAQAPADNSVALGAHSVADQPNTISVGSEGNERRVTNVAPGIAGTDAVNVNQLKSGLGEVSRNAYSGVAAATALTMIPDVDANKTLSVGVGYGTYKGYSAAALGGTARITQNIKVRVGAGWSSSGTTVGAGAAYQW